MYDRYLICTYQNICKILVFVFFSYIFAEIYSSDHIIFFKIFDKTITIDFCYIIKNQNIKTMKKPILTVLALLLAVLSIAQNNNGSYVEFRGRVIDKQTKNPLSYCNIMVEGTNIATVTNTDGEFVIKVPQNQNNVRLTFRYLGYMSRKMSAEELLLSDGVVDMSQVAYQLPQIDVMIGDANQIVRTMFDRFEQNYPTQEMFMTAFYRESIRKNRNYVSLSEAVVDIHKQPYNSFRSDLAKLFKSRKQADYTRLDTLVFKLMGGPYNNLFLDVVKNPEIVFTEEVFKKYYFSFEKLEWMDDKLVYVIKFNHYKQDDEALYSGRLYIDAKSFALKSAVFDLSFTNEEKAINMLIRKKPANAKVMPLQATYRVDYVEHEGKWYYAYSRIEIGMRINWRRKLFNTNYYATIEMAITDRENSSDNRAIRFRDRLRSDVIISETAAGFSDPDFWGPHNVIEPEKPIEAAIRKIQRQNDKK